jgi:hypothetical protein
LLIAQLVGANSFNFPLRFSSVLMVSNSDG